MAAGASNDAGPRRFSYPSLHLSSPDYLELAPIRRAAGTVKMPGSKSISNRILLLAALAEGETRILELLDSDDTRHMLTALHQLGIACEPDGPALRVQGAGGAFKVKSAELFLGNAGTHSGRSRPRWRYAAETIACLARRACTSGPSAIWSTPLRGPGGAHRLPGRDGFIRRCRSAPRFLAPAPR